MTGRIVRSCFLVTVMLAALSGSGARGQMPAGFELALVGVDGTKKVLGQLPPTVYAARISPLVAGAINWAPMWTPDGERRLARRSTGSARAAPPGGSPDTHPRARRIA